MELRGYQQKSIADLYKWFEAGNKGHPCIVLPTGSGKSHIVAALCKDAIQTWPETRILMLTHVKELIEQNAEKMRQHWPNAPMGIYSASMRQKQLGEPITFAGVQSIYKKAHELGHIDLVIIDECHLVNHKDDGSYRMLLGRLLAINPNLRVVGLTATPFRLGHGLITDEPAIFADLIEPISIEELVFAKFLAPLRSKHTTAQMDTSGVHKRGGEFIESELQAAVNTSEKNKEIVNEVIERAGDRKSWLFFCTGVEHAKCVAEVLTSRGIETACVVGETPKAEREQILRDFKAGKIQALTNANVLTTGFDAPNIDLIAMLRPTLSASLYVQMAGRGMRLKDHTDHCLVLDFAGVVSTHGPITNVRPPQKGGDGDGPAPVKTCPACNELIPISAMICTSCGYEYTRIDQSEKLALRNDDIMGKDETLKMVIDTWRWREHISRTSGKSMLAVDYYGKDISDPRITEYFPVTHGGYAAQKAINQLNKCAAQAKVVKPLKECEDLADLATTLNTGLPPASIVYTQDGKFYRVAMRAW